jgi:prepilin-type N-terminal cleavage/methylation domain-containing protein
MHRNEKGFTLMELMVVIVIVAILAAVAVPLYINYVKDAQRTEAKAAIGAIITAEQAYYLKSPGFNPSAAPSYATVAELATRGFLDPNFLTDIQQRWTITDEGTPDASSYGVTAKNASDPNVVVKYTYTQAGGGVWVDDPPPTP